MILLLNLETIATYFNEFLKISAFCEFVEFDFNDFLRFKNDKFLCRFFFLQSLSTSVFIFSFVSVTILLFAGTLKQNQTGLNDKTILTSLLKSPEVGLD